MWSTYHSELTSFGTQQISFARTRSDAVVKKVDGENFDEHKTRREEHKSM